jgi:hypothetical protein
MGQEEKARNSSTCIWTRQLHILSSRMTERGSLEPPAVQGEVYS